MAILRGPSRARGRRARHPVETVPTYFFGGSQFFSQVGGSLVSPHEKSDSTSLPGRFVEAETSVPAAVQLNCWLLLFTADALTWQMLPDDHVA
jgi:hypothetical protein